MLSDRVQLSSAEALVEEIKGGSVGVFCGTAPGRVGPREQKMLKGPLGTLTTLIYRVVSRNEMIRYPTFFKVG